MNRSVLFSVAVGAVLLSRADGRELATKMQAVEAKNPTTVCNPIDIRVEGVGEPFALDWVQFINKPKGR